MYQIICDLCQTKAEVQWSPLFIGWLKEGRPLTITAGTFTVVDKREGEYLKMLGHSALPLPDGWQYVYDMDDTPTPDTHLCPDCKAPNA